MTSSEKYKQPSRYSPVIAAINWRLRKYAEEQQRVTYVDCNDLLLQSSTQVQACNPFLTPALATCIDPGTHSATADSACIDSTTMLHAFVDRPANTSVQVCTTTVCDACRRSTRR